MKIKNIMTCGTALLFVALVTVLSGCKELGEVANTAIDVAHQEGVIDAEQAKNMKSGTKKMVQSGTEMSYSDEKEIGENLFSTGNCSVQVECHQGP